MDCCEITLSDRSPAVRQVEDDAVEARLRLMEGVIDASLARLLEPPAPRLAEAAAKAARALFPALNGAPRGKFRPTRRGRPMKIQFVTSFAPIVRDIPTSQSFYKNALGLSFEGGDGDYVFTSKLDGCKHLGLWPLKDAAQACFGQPQWPADIPVPQASIEFEVADEAAVAEAAKELEARGQRLLHPARTEPWKQVLCRLLSPEGLLVGICYTPSFHERHHAPA